MYVISLDWLFDIEEHFFGCKLAYLENSSYLCSWIIISIVMEQRVVFSRNLQSELTMAIAECMHDKIFVLADETTAQLCWPRISGFLSLKKASLITIPAGDVNKSLNSVSHVWQALSQGGATRHSLMINLGGGMVTDLGGFAASTFKRGINFINMPTTLLSMVDASVGGKTGINFNGLKNEIGTFRIPDYVIIDVSFLSTLDHTNLLSGYAEMIKHGLISNEKMWAQLLNFDLSATDDVLGGESNRLDVLELMLSESVAVKKGIVDEDPLEHGIRKALNLGHTVGHAFESFAMASGRPVLHGYAVAWGIVCELYLSAVKVGFPASKLRQTVNYIRDNYGTMAITCNDYPDLLKLMKHDKKNTSGIINFTLLGDIGDIRINQTATEDEIKDALDFYREG